MWNQRALRRTDSPIEENCLEKREEKLKQSKVIFREEYIQADALSLVEICFVKLHNLNRVLFALQIGTLALRNLEFDC